jgi:hypothetical protein
MMRKMEAREDQGLEGLRVIGFHGEVNPARTPARCGPIYSDTEGHLVRIERVEPSSQKETATIWLRVGPRVGEGLLPGDATRLEEPLPAFLGHLFVVLGKDERSHAPQLRAMGGPLETPALSQFLDWFAGGALLPPRGLPVRRLGDAVAWYCASKDAFSLHQRITSVALEELIQAARVRNEKGLYQASWWLSRAGLDDMAQFLAAVGLERSSPAMASAFVRGVFARRSPEEIEAGLARARNMFLSLCQPLAPPVSPRPNIGKLLARRSLVRKQNLVEVPTA